MGGFMLIRESELMSSQELILTIDIGTSSCKVCLFDLSGAIRATAKSEYPTLSPQPSFAEQDVSAIYSGIVQSVKAVLSKHSPSRVIALACDTMLHSTLLLDEEGDPLYPLLNWMDTRCQDELKSLNQEYQEKRFYFRNGVPLHTIYNLPRLIWFRKHYPSFLQSAWKIVTIKDWFLGKITGEWYCDYSTASGTGLLNLFDRRWDEELVSCAQVSTKQFLPLCEPDHHFPLQVGPFTHDTGLLPGIPVVWGGGDGPFANLGEGMFHQREMVITVGSSGAVRMCDHQPVFDPNQRSWCYYLADGIWVGGGAINNGGIVYSWMNDLLNDNNQWEIDPQRPRPLFLPFLTGERSPNWNAQARGILFGLSYFHTKEALMQSAYEGIAFRIRSIYELLKDIIGDPRQVVVNGGFGISPKGSRILSHVLGIPLQLSEFPSAPCRGAFFLAIKALGQIKRLDEISQNHLNQLNILQPNPDYNALYDQLYRFYEKVYQANRGLFQEFSELNLA